MTAAELAEKLERLDALFVELYNYAESQSLSDTMSKSGANALRAIKGSIGNRYNVIPQAAARLRSMEDALKPIHEIWSGAEDDCDNGGYVEEHIRERVAVFTENNSKNLDRHLLCDLVEKLGRKARAAISGEGQ